MAAETSEPRSGLVLKIGFLSIALIVGVRFLLMSYFHTQFDDEYTRKIGSRRNEDLVMLREQAKKALASSPVPIERAMEIVATRPRDENIAPRPSEDTAALIGWGLAPKPLPVMPAATIETAPAPSASASASAPAAAVPATSGKTVNPGAPKGSDPKAQKP